MNVYSHWQRRLAGEILPEVWEEAPVYSRRNRYEISSHGRLRNADSGCIRKGSLDPAGYFRQRIQHKTFKVHRLVATVFIPNPDKLPEVNHLDAVRTNNYMENLEWCSHRGNALHALALGLMRPHIGSMNGASKLIEPQIIEIRRRYANGEIQIALAADFGVSQRMISLIVRREKWTHV